MTTSSSVAQFGPCRLDFDTEYGSITTMFYPKFQNVKKSYGQIILNSKGVSGGYHLILGLRPANERRRYFVTTSLIGWAQA